MNGLNAWTEPFKESYDSIVNDVLGFVPNILAAIIIFVIGWIVAGLLSKAIAQIIKAIKLNEALNSAGIGEAVSKTGVKLNAGKFLGEAVRWFVIVVVFVAVLNIFNLQDVNAFLGGVVLNYIPMVIAAVLILVIAALVAEFLRKVVVAGANGLDIAHANFLGAITKYSIWVVAILAALAQLGIAAYFIQTLYTGVVVALALALGLSFGLGGQDAAAKFIDKVRDEIKK